MGEFWMFVATIFGGGIFLFIASLPLDKPIGEALLRVGLWMNGIERAECGRIMEFRRTRKLPE